MDRHRWFHPREHVYLCVKCGTGKEHVCVDGQWLTLYYTPNGRTETGKTPPCEPGPLSIRYIGKYAERIATEAPELLHG